MKSNSNILSIPLLKRTTENSTHNNIVDESIKDIIPYKISITNNALYADQMVEILQNFDFIAI